MKETRGIIKSPITESTELERPFEQQINTPGRYPSYRENLGTEGFNILDYWRAIRKRLWLIIGITVLITTLAAIYMARKPNIYQAKAVVQVDQEQTNPDLVSPDRARPVINTDPSYFNTQLQLLYSETLLRRVIKEHNLDSNKEFQVAKGEESVSPWRAILKSIGLASDDGSKGGTGENRVPNSSIATSEEVAEAVRLMPYVDIIRKNISVEPVRESRQTVKDTRLIEITFRNPNPDLAAYVVNGIAETFINQNQEKRSGTNRKTNDFLQDRMSSLQSDIKRDEEHLVELFGKEGILKVDGETTLVIQRLSGLNKDLLAAENERKNAEANYETVDKNPERVKALADDQMGRFIQDQENVIRNQQAELQKKIADLRQNRELLLQNYQEGAPAIQKIDVQIKSYENSIDNLLARFKTDLERYRQQATSTILTNLKTTYLRAKDREDKIRADFNKQYNEAQGQNQGAVSLKILQQTIDTNKGFLENLRKQVSGNDITAQGTDNNISVAEPAIPNDTAVSPRRLMTVIAALFLSTLFGMGLALFLEYLDDTIRSTEEIENYLQLPALAAIPSFESMPKRRLALVGAEDEAQHKENSELLIYADSRSALAEAYRQLRTSILLSTAGHAPKSLLITSSLPSEGKTTTATNTAISLAQTGAKVLIIDGDMRRPRLHSVFNVGNGEGLSTLLSSELSENEILSVIKQDPGTKLHLLTSGPIPPNPAELIGSEQMANIMRFLQKEFTHVVIDSPPISSFTDGVLIASMVDGVILVVHAGKSSRQVIRRSRQLLQDVGAKIFGVVLNNVNIRSQDNYYYYQSYYHGNSYTAPEEK